MLSCKTFPAPCSEPFGKPGTVTREHPSSPRPRTGPRGASFGPLGACPNLPYLPPACGPWLLRAAPSVHWLPLGSVVERSWWSQYTQRKPSGPTVSYQDHEAERLCKAPCCRCSVDAEPCA